MNPKRFIITLSLSVLIILSFVVRTSAEVKILAISPTGRVEGRDATYTVTVTFNQPMVPLAKLPEGDGTGPLEIEPHVKGNFRWQGTSVLSFTPKEPLPLATEFIVTVPKGVESKISGEVLENKYTWTFETLRPDLLISYPYERQDWVELDEKIYLFFNQDMNPKCAMSFITIKETNLEGDDRELYFGIRYKVDKDSATLSGIEYYQARMLQKQKNTCVLVIAPEGGFKKNCSYTVILAKGLLANKGNLGLFSERIIHFKTYKTFKFIRPDSWSALEPTNGLEFLFTNPVKYADLLNVLTIKPKVEFPENYYRYQHFSYCNTVSQSCAMHFNVELKPSLTYSVTIKGSLTDKYGQILGEDIETSFTTTDFAPTIYMPNGMGIVERYIKPLRHPITFLNVDKVYVQMAKINSNDIVTLGQENFNNKHNSITPPGGYQYGIMWGPEIKKNEKTLHPVELNKILGDSKYGIVYLQIDALENLADNTRYRHAFLQVTSMGITGKFSPDGNLIYVSYLKTANPVINCDVELRNDKNELLWTGRTDKLGFTKTPGWEELKIVPIKEWEKPKIWVIAKKEGDIAFIHSGWGTGIYPYHFSIPYEWYPQYPKYGGHIFTERGIYRPGETVHIKGIIREKRLGKWEIPRITEYNLFIKDSRSQEIMKDTITLSDFGAFDYTFNIDENSPTGYYTIHLWQKDVLEKQGVAPEYQTSRDSDDRKIRLSSSFRVEEYKPATFEVNVNYNKDEYILGDTADVKINGWYLFGAPMSESELQYTVRMKRRYFRPEGHPGYVFGGYTWEDREYYSSEDIILSKNSKLDKQGNYSFTCPLTSNKIGPFDLITEGVVTAPDRQRLAGRKTAIVHAGEYYIGLKPESTFIEKGKNIQIDIITVLPDGKKVMDKELAVSLKRVEWNSVRKAGVGGRLEWKTEQVEVDVTNFTLKTSLQPYIWIYTPDKAGYYIFKVEGKDSINNKVISSQSFYVTGQDYCAWYRSDDDRIELICDKTKYKPGETAKILIKSPYENAIAVVTLEREGIIDQWRTLLIGSADTIDIPLTTDHLPNVFVCVMLYQGRVSENKFSEQGDDIGKPSFKIGYTNLPVDPGEKNLSVVIEQDKREYRPGNKVKVKLNVTDSNQKGVASEVTLAVVDLGILNIINYKTPDSFPHFYGPRPLSVETAETRLHIIGQRNYGEKGENRGGGGGVSATGFDLRAKFLPTVYWNPAVLTDEDGNAEVSFTLPDNLTTFRIMASAQTKDSCFGAGENRFLVNKPLILKPSLPRFTRVEDTFNAGVLCHNNSSEDSSVYVEVKVKGITLIGKNKQEIFIPKGEAKEIKFDFLAEKMGQAEFIFTAKMGDETDGLKWEIPITVPKATEAVATYGSTIDKSEEDVEIPSDIYDDASSINISIAPTALVGLKGGLEYLFDYPYGCLEQKTSKILPLILAGDFIEIFNLAPLKEHTSRELITGFLKELVQFQTSSGGFTFWKGREMPSPYLTAYVLWSLAEAKGRGFAVNEDMREKAAQYLRRYIRDDELGWSWPYNINESLCTKAFCLYSLSINGFHEQSYINNLYQKLDQIPLFGKIYLLKAIHNEKMNQTMIDTIVQDLSNKAKFSPTEVHFEESDDRGMEWIWHSNVRTTAAVLQGLLDVKGTYPNAEKVARWLARERKSGRWLTTQENIYVFYAFSEYVKKYEKETPDFTAKILLGQKEIISEVFKGRTLEAKSRKLSVDVFKRDIILPVVFEKTGTGRLYYDFRMIYAPKGELEPREEGIYVEKKIEPFKTGSIDENTFDLSGQYKITIKVKTQQERHFVVVDDPLPAGFEVVNLSFSTESQEERREFREDTRNTFYRWWGTFDHWENYDDRVFIFANYLERGEHTYSYLVQATTKGKFLMPPTKAEEMYTPEVFGRTKQRRIIIR